MCFHVGIINIMHVVGGNQVDAGFLMHTQQGSINGLLFRNTVVLQFQKEISLTENFLKAQGRSFTFFVKATL